MADWVGRVKCQRFRGARPCARSLFAVAKFGTGGGHETGEVMKPGYVILELEVPVETAADVRAFLERDRTGQLVLHVVHGDVVGGDCTSQTRLRPRDRGSVSVNPTPQIPVLSQESSSNTHPSHLPARALSPSLSSIAVRG